MSQVVKAFIREAINSADSSGKSRHSTVRKTNNFVNKKPIINEMYAWAWLQLLKGLTPTAGTGSARNPCESFKEVLKVEQDRRTAFAIAGFALGGLAVAEGVALSTTMAKEGMGLIQTGNRLRGAIKLTLASLGAAGSLITANDIYKLYILAFVPADEQNKTQSQINREMYDIIGNIYISWAVSAGLTSLGSTRTGGEIIDHLTSQKSFSDFARFFIEKYSQLKQSRTFSAVAALGLWPATNAETWFAQGAAKNLKSLDRNAVYTIDEEFVRNNLMAHIDTDGIGANTAIIAAELYRKEILEKIEMMCKNNITPEEYPKVESLVTQYEDLSNALGL